MTTVRSTSRSSAALARAVVPFAVGRSGRGVADRALLGGKGAGLVEMCRLGAPVPPGFIITTDVCRFFYQRRPQYPGAARGAVERGVRFIEGAMGRRLGDPTRPLLLSVRSGAPVSMPGMMDTVLNVGLTGVVLDGLAREYGDRRFPLDCYRRLIDMYGDVVRGVDRARFHDVLAAVRRHAGVTRDAGLDTGDLEEVVRGHRAVFEEATGEPFPDDPYVQLWGAIDAVFASWMSPRAVTYRRIRGISHDLGTAVTVQGMVFGNRNERSASGVCFTRDPGSGARVFFGEFLPNAQGEDVVAGIRTPQPMRRDERDGTGLATFEESFPAAYEQLLQVRDQLERHYGDMQDIEFTVEDEKLYILQTRRGQRTGPAALRIACDMMDEGLATSAQAVAQVQPEGLVQVLAPAFRAADVARAADRLIAHGLAASPGGAAGRIALDAARAVALGNEKNGPVILVRTETSAEDIAGMEAAAAIVTTRGGKTSHAAVVARGMGKPCVVACADLEVDEHARRVRGRGGTVLEEGELLSIDGSSGGVYRGALPVEKSEVLQALEGDRAAADSPAFRTFERLLGFADQERRLGVRANADTPADARLARLLGAQGIGLCRTEHMFFGADRILPFRRMILASTLEERRRALDCLLPLQRDDFRGIFQAMEDLPVTIRLLDPPLHEFLPDGPDEIERFAREADIPRATVEARVAETREANPMLGLRGCRLGMLYPEIYAMQVRAIVEAAIDVSRAGKKVLPEIMLPLIAFAAEVDRLRELYVKVRDDVCAEHGVGDRRTPAFLFGTMIEVPRAALAARALAERLDFFSFGTNDLTQMTLGLSRDDTGPILRHYVETGAVPHDPFASLDEEGVGRLIEIAVTDGRAANPRLKIGICGEHGGDPRSIAFCDRAGFDYVSASPYRVPVARLAAAQAALATKKGRKKK